MAVWPCDFGSVVAWHIRAGDTGCGRCSRRPESINWGNRGEKGEEKRRGEQRKGEEGR